MSDYTSDSVINDLKVDSTTSLPVHIDETGRIIDVNVGGGKGEYAYHMQESHI